MLVAALLLAAIGFLSLVLALWQGSTGWAWACTIVAAIGVILFVIDWYKHRSKRHRS